MDEREQFLQALADLDRALDENARRSEAMKARIAELQSVIAQGRPLGEAVSAEKPPLIVTLLTESADVFHSYGSRVRRTEALALHREGLTMDQIAVLFGVSRQRVSALLRDEPRSA